MGLRFFITGRRLTVDHVDKIVTVHVSESRFGKGGVVRLKDGRISYAIADERECRDPIGIDAVLNRDQFAVMSQVRNDLLPQVRARMAEGA